MSSGNVREGSCGASIIYYVLGTETKIIVATLGRGRMKARSVIAASLLIALGCADSTAPKVTLSGSWVGTVGSQVITVALLDNGGSITGNGTITNTPTGTRALTVTGTFVKPSVSLTLSSGTATPFSLAATVNSSAMTGTLNGSGFTGEGITLARQ